MGHPFVISTTLERATALLEELDHSALPYSTRGRLIRELIRDIEATPIADVEPAVLSACDPGDER
jgi:hypothetical protein